METTINELQTLVKSVVDNSWQVGDGIKRTEQQNGQPTSLNNNCNENAASNKRALSKKRWKVENKTNVNASERDRKERLAANILKLKEVLPIKGNRSMTKEKVVEEATSYIMKLVKKQEEVLKSNTSESLYNELKELRQKVVELKEETKRYQAVLLSHAIPPVLNKNEPWKMKISRTTKSNLSKTKKKSVSKNGLPNESATVPASEPQTDKTSSLGKENTTAVTVSLPGDTESTVTSSAKQSDDCVTSAATEDRAKVQDVQKRITDFWNVAALLCILKCCFASKDQSNSKSQERGAQTISDANPATENAPRDNEISAESVEQISRQNDALANKESFLETPSSKSTPLAQNAAEKNDPQPPNNTLLPIQAQGNQIIPDASKQQQQPRQTDRPASLQLDKSIQHEAVLTQHIPSPSPQVDDNLLAWLRSEAPTSNGVEAMRSNLSPIHTQVDTSVSNSIAAVKDSSALQKRPAMNSFNIASLMKSNDDPQLSLLPREKKEQAPAEHEGLDFAGATPKDVMHQSFETDIFDCLQGLTTPEPPTRQGTGKLDAFIRTSAPGREHLLVPQERRRDQHLPLDLHDLLHTEGAQSHSAPVVPMEQLSYSIARNHASQHNTQRQHFAYTHPQQQQQHQVPTSLWQPAIADSSHPKPFPDCFSPGHYITPTAAPQTQRPRPHPHIGATPRGRITQALPPNVGWFAGDKSSTPAAYSSSAGNANLNSGGMLTSVPTPQVEVTKKRKGQKSSASSKKKKLSSSAKGGQCTTTTISKQPQRPDNDPRPNITQNQVPPAPLRLYPHPPCPITPEERRMYPGVQNINPHTAVVGHPPCVGYNPEIGGQTALFHPHTSLGQQGGGYPAPHHAPYFSYNHRLPQNQQLKYVPSFANNSNNNNNATGKNHHKGSQHHIRQILG